MPWTLRMTLYAFAVVVLPYLFVGWRLTDALGLVFPQYKKWTKRAVILLFVFLNLLPFFVLISFLLGDSQQFIYETEVSLGDILLIFPFWIGFLTIFEIFFYFVATEIFQFILKKSVPEKYIKWRTPFACFKVILFILFLGFVAVKSYSDTYTVRTASQPIKIADLPAEFSGLNLVLVGDIQIDRYTQQKKIDGFYRELKNSNPDILFFAGDLVTRGTHYIPQGLQVMCGANARIKRIACVGDHDIWSDAQQIAEGLAACNWEFLDNSNHIINYRGKKILVTGVTYVYSRRINPGQLSGLIESAPEADLKILLVHQPSQMVIRAAREAGYHIMLAGHTHGGQMVFKPFGLTLTPTMFENSFYSGYYDLNPLHFFVTNGIGLTMMPIRFRAPAEIEQIIISPK